MSAIPNAFRLGDAGSSPNSKTGAAIRKQAPVVAANLAAVMTGREPSQVYDGYASCPLTTARNQMLLAEFHYTMKPYPDHPADQHPEGALRHVAAQAVRGCR
jgi:sulfide:quinone oxidoreductase